ncbi:MAG: hypothetical protein LC797_16590 [Chloroflexi bacterium]|nr:hypothetical protein [Chloroflexota bacterium]
MPDDTLVDEQRTSTEAVEVRPKRARAIATQPVAASSRAGARATPVPFSAYSAEYAYVLNDLRRVGLVIGSLLVILLLLYFVLPR